MGKSRLTLGVLLACLLHGQAATGGPWDGGRDRVQPFDECLEYRDYLRTIGGIGTGGRAFRVATLDQHAYVIDNETGLLVIDFSTPESPSLIAQRPLSHNLTGIAVVRQTLYVLSRTGLSLFDLSDPGAPFLIGQVELFVSTDAMAVVDGYAYLVGRERLQVVDVSDSAVPEVVAALAAFDYAQCITVLGTIAYVGNSPNGIVAVDIANPRQPSVVAELATPGSIYGMKVSSGILYAAETEHGEEFAHTGRLHTIDLSVPADPTILASLIASGRGTDVVVRGAHAFMGNGSSGVSVIDVANPDAPVVIAVADTPGFAAALALGGDVLCVASGSSGLQFVGVANPEPPRAIGSLETPGMAHRMRTHGGYLYIVDGTSGVAIVDVSNPDVPRTVGTMDTPSFSMEIEFQDGHAYVANHVDGVHVFDVADPTRPQLLWSVDTPGDARGLALNTDYAYVADGEGGLQVVDVRQRMIVGSVEADGSFSRVALLDSVVYVTDARRARLHAVDVRDPSQPRIVRTMAIFQVGNILIRDDYLYVGDYYGLRVVDISDRFAPVIVGRVDTPGKAYGVALDGGLAYVANESWGLQIIDIWDPTAPTRVGNAFVPGTARSAAVAQDRVFVVDELGLNVFPVQCDVRVAVLASDLEAMALDNGIVVRWSVHRPEDFREFTVFRAVGRVTRRDAYTALNASEPVPGRGPWEYEDRAVIPGESYSYRVAGTLGDGSSIELGPVLETARLRVDVPVLRASPSPFTSGASIEFSVPSGRTARLRIYDATGRLVRRLHPPSDLRGTSHWDGLSSTGARVASGVYFVHLDWGTGYTVRKLTRLR